MKCYFCDHNVKAGGVYQHLKKHKIVLRDFIETPEGEKWYEEYKKENNEIFKSRSPFSPNFKGCDNNDITRQNRVKNIIEVRKINRQNKIEQEKELYGDEYDNIVNERNKLKGQKQKETEIKKLCKKYDVDESRAYEIYCLGKAANSPRSKEYWLSKGYSEEEASEKVSEWQKLMSPRSKEYWLSKGYSGEEASEKVSELQKGFARLNPSANRGDNSVKDNLKRRLFWIKQNDRNFLTKYNYEHLLVDENVEELSNNIDAMFEILLEYNNYKSDKNREKSDYKKAVMFFTELNAPYVKDIDKRSFDYHLDHIYSVDEGFKNNVSPEIVGSVVNLRIITREENRKKGKKCSITLEELLDKFAKHLKKRNF